MTKAHAARCVLADCRLAHQFLENELNADRWRILWVGAVSLIRSVGHVLEKIDGSEDHALRSASRSAFKRWKLGEGDDIIFKDFIDAQRNDLLKEYQFRTDLREAVPVTTAYKDGKLHDLDENLFRPMVDGYGAGEDARDVYIEAVCWLEKELDKIERDARNA